MLARRAPFGVTPKLVGDANVTLPGRIERDREGRLVYKQRAQQLGLYVLGATRSSLVDTLGILLVFGAFGGAVAHGSLRWRSARKRRARQASNTEPKGSTRESEP